MVAASTLAARRIGAIIVIERQIGLRNYIEGGIPLDATITYDLLATIFQPGSPLHDGAVIVQGDRIAAAACFLPLSINPQVSRELGTRHRAALGITEENDADRDRRLRRDRRDHARVGRCTRARVRRRSVSAIDCERCSAGRADRRASGTGLSGLMAILSIRHVGLKVVSVVLAALLWLLVSGEQTVERALRIPLEFTNLPPQLELVGSTAGRGGRSCARVVRNTGSSCGGRIVRGPRRSDRANRAIGCFI